MSKVSHLAHLLLSMIGICFPDRVLFWGLQTGRPASGAQPPVDSRMTSSTSIMLTTGIGSNGSSIAALSRS